MPHEMDEPAAATDFDGLVRHPARGSYAVREFAGGDRPRDTHQ
jgi:hypothetical protein